jgi:sulfide:quinone oxidoreductase
MPDVSSDVPRRRLRLVVAGAGIAGLEALVALHTLAPGRIAPTLIDPGDAFRLRALDIGARFGMRPPRPYPLTDLAHDLGAVLVRQRVARVDHSDGTVVVHSGRRIGYDALLIATGSRLDPAMSEGVVFDPAHGPDTLASLAAQAAGHTAVVVPDGVGWTLPAYELALMLSAQQGGEVTLVTAERTPLEAFGRPGARLAREELEAAGVALRCGARAVATSPTRLGLEGGDGLDVDRIVHLPRHVGPGIPGLPRDAAGFVPAGPDGAVPGMAGVFAAGDGTAGAIKQGGLAAQQGERAALSIAALAGADVGRVPSEPALHGILLTPRGPRYLRAAIAGADLGAEVSRRPLWWPPTKVASAWLAPWLTSREANRTAPDGTRRPVRPAGDRRAASFRRVVVSGGPGGAPRVVTFERSAVARSGWRIADADGASAALVTLADAVSLLSSADRIVAIAVHESALEATCALIGALHEVTRNGSDPGTLRRLERLASQAAELAAELAAVRDDASARRRAASRRARPTPQ